MRFRYLLLFGISFFFLNRASAEEVGKLVTEVWEVAVVTDKESGKDQKIGYSHFSVHEIEQNGAKILRARKELRMSIARGKDIVDVKAEVGTDENAEGIVVGVYMKQWLGKDQTLILRGTLKEHDMHIVYEGGAANEKKFPWSPKIVGLVKEQMLLRDHKAKPGDQFSYKFYEPTLNTFFMIDVSVIKEEEVDLPGGKRKLLRVEAKPEKIMGVQLPISILWVEPTSYTPVVTQSELPGIATFKLIRSTKEAALAANGKVPELFASQSIRLKNRIENIHTATAITYRVTLGADAVESKDLVREDPRQTIDKLEKNSFTLHVESIRRPQPVEKPGKIGAEYKTSNYFITSDDAKVQELAKAAVGTEKDDWAKAQKIEFWVKRNMKVLDFSEALATASHVAQTLTGDCTEFAMLCAAMCRAEGIPSRTAIGLVYVEDRNQVPMFAFHMWTEVYVKDQWLALDATIGRGSIGPGHIKVTDHHWNNIRAFDPLLPVTGFMLAKPSIEVIAVRRPN